MPLPTSWSICSGLSLAHIYGCAISGDPAACSSRTVLRRCAAASRSQRSHSARWRWLVSSSCRSPCCGFCGRPRRASGLGTLPRPPGFGWSCLRPSLTEESFAEPDGTVSVLSTAQVETWDGLVFSVSHEELPEDADLSDEASILDAMRDGAIESAVLQKGQAVVVQGVSGREFVAHGLRSSVLLGRAGLPGELQDDYADGGHPGNAHASACARHGPVSRSFSIADR